MAQDRSERSLVCTRRDPVLPPYGEGSRWIMHSKIATKVGRTKLKSSATPYRQVLSRSMPMLLSTK
jgi:hypothetical protein